MPPGDQLRTHTPRSLTDADQNPHSQVRCVEPSFHARTTRPCGRSCQLGIPRYTRTPFGRRCATLSGDPRRRGDTAAAAIAVRQITARLTEQHGAAAVRDLVDALALELAEANSAVESMREADGNGATSTTGPTRGSTVLIAGSTTSTGLNSASMSP